VAGEARPGGATRRPVGRSVARSGTIALHPAHHRERTHFPDLGTRAATTAARLIPPVQFS